VCRIPNFRRRRNSENLISENQIFDLLLFIWCYRGRVVTPNVDTVQWVHLNNHLFTAAFTANLDLHEALYYRGWSLSGTVASSTRTQSHIDSLRAGEFLQSRLWYYSFVRNDRAKRSDSMGGECKWSSYVVPSNLNRYLINIYAWRRETINF
jgi:hypothetical protein